MLQAGSSVTFNQDNKLSPALPLPLIRIINCHPVDIFDELTVGVQSVLAPALKLLLASVFEPKLL